LQWQVTTHRTRAGGQSSRWLRLSSSVIGVAAGLITLGIFFGSENAELKVVHFVIFDEPLL